MAVEDVPRVSLDGARSGAVLDAASTVPALRASWPGGLLTPQHRDGPAWCERQTTDLEQPLGPPLGAAPLQQT